jgi:predicted ABC-type ATPase
MAPKVVIIAGPNGSGKTTLTREFLARYGIELPEAYINPDDLARQSREQKPEAKQAEIDVQAFKDARALRQEYREKSVAFAFETVFSHPSNLVDLQKLNDAGYDITLVVLMTNSPEINVERVAERVKLGGHNVNPDKIRRRYQRFASFLPLAVERATSVFVFDSGKTINLCYHSPNPTRVIQSPYLLDSVPQYLREMLVSPLLEREECRQLIATAITHNERVQLPNEGGIFEGEIRLGTSCYCLQEVDAHNLVMHERVLLTKAVQEGETVKIEYDQGYGNVG